MNEVSINTFFLPRNNWAVHRLAEWAETMQNKTVFDEESGCRPNECYWPACKCRFYPHALGRHRKSPLNMETIVAAHKYKLRNQEDPDSYQVLSFIRKGLIDPDDHDSKLATIEDGTTTEEVLQVLIDRVTKLNSQWPCRENSLAITNLEQALMWLEKRTRDRVARGVEGHNKA